MQTRKRAKPVKFGKSTAKTEHKEKPQVVDPTPSSEVEVKEEITVHKSSIIKSPEPSVARKVKEVLEAEEVSEKETKGAEEPEKTIVTEEKSVKEQTPEVKQALEEAESVLASASKEAE